jgi:hypothetical protein
LADGPPQPSLERAVTWWNHRPIEDALRARLAAAEEVIAAYVRLKKSIDAGDEPGSEPQKDARTRIRYARAKWEAMK